MVLAGAILRLLIQGKTEAKRQSKLKPPVKMSASGGPEAEVDTVDVNTTMLPNGTPRLITYSFLNDEDGRQLTVAESLRQAVGQQAAIVNPRLQLSGGRVIQMNPTNKMMDYLIDLTADNGTLLLY